MQPFLKQQFKHRLMVVFSRSQWLYTVVLVDNDMAILGQLKVDLLEMKNDSHVLINATLGLPEIIRTRVGLEIIPH